MPAIAEHVAELSPRILSKSPLDLSGTKLQFHLISPEEL